MIRAAALHSTAGSEPARKQRAAIHPAHIPVWFARTASMLDGTMIQRKSGCSCGGGCPTCSDELDDLHVQTKLEINAPGEQFEQEADRMAEQVMRISKPQPCNDELPSQANLPTSGPMTGFVRKVEPAHDGQSDCSPTWFGDTSPEVDPSGGSFTGKLIVKYNDAALKSPCVRECVEEHEAVHVAHLTPIVKMIHECDVAAGNDWEKKGKCNEMANRDLAAIQKRSECEAYRKSFTCLTLKVLDSKSPCSKPPHRDEVQKHRGYEACEMKRYCAEAGTPELGIPNA
jgi:hypothetical protein